MLEDDDDDDEEEEAAGHVRIIRTGDLPRVLIKKVSRRISRQQVLRLNVSRTGCALAARWLKVYCLGPLLQER